MEWAADVEALKRVVGGWGGGGGGGEGVGGKGGFQFNVSEANSAA